MQSFDSWAKVVRTGDNILAVFLTICWSKSTLQLNPNLSNMGFWVVSCGIERRARQDRKDVGPTWHVSPILCFMKSKPADLHIQLAGQAFELIADVPRSGNGMMAKTVRHQLLEIVFDGFVDANNQG